MDVLITERFDKILAEKDGNGDTNDAESSADEAADEAVVSENSSPVNGKAGSASPVNRKKRKSSSLDADAKLAAELHAQLNGGRASRSTRKKSSKPVARGKRSKKSKDTVYSSDDDAAGKPEKKKRKANPNSAFNKPLMLSEALANLVGEQQVLLQWMVLILAC